MNNVSLIKLNTIQLYLNISKKILYMEILNSNYSKEDSITILEYFKNFWILAKDNNVRYYLIVIINNIGIYPLSFYMNLLNYLNDLNSLFTKHLIAFCFLCKDKDTIKILNPLFNLYKFIRPYAICNSYEESMKFFYDSKCL